MLVSEAPASHRSCSRSSSLLGSSCSSKKTKKKKERRSKNSKNNHNNSSCCLVELEEGNGNDSFSLWEQESVALDGSDHSSNPTNDDSKTADISTSSQSGANNNNKTKLEDDEDEEEEEPLWAPAKFPTSRHRTKTKRFSTNKRRQVTMMPHTNEEEEPQEFTLEIELELDDPETLRRLSAGGTASFNLADYKVMALTPPRERRMMAKNRSRSLRGLQEEDPNHLSASSHHQEDGNISPTGDDHEEDRLERRRANANNRRRMRKTKSLRGLNISNEATNVSPNETTRRSGGKMRKSKSLRGLLTATTNEANCHIENGLNRKITAEDNKSTGSGGSGGSRRMKKAKSLRGLTALQDDGLGKIAVGDNKSTGSGGSGGSGGSRGSRGSRMKKAKSLRGLTALEDEIAAGDNDNKTVTSTTSSRASRMRKAKSLRGFYDLLRDNQKPNSSSSSHEVGSAMKKSSSSKSLSKSLHHVASSGSLKKSGSAKSLSQSHHHLSSGSLSSTKRSSARRSRRSEGGIMKKSKSLRGLESVDEEKQLGSKRNATFVPTRTRTAATRGMMMMRKSRSSKSLVSGGSSSSLGWKDHVEHGVEEKTGERPDSPPSSRGKQMRKSRSSRELLLREEGAPTTKAHEHEDEVVDKLDQTSVVSRSSLEGMLRKTKSLRGFDDLFDEDDSLLMYKNSSKKSSTGSPRRAGRRSRPSSDCRHSQSASDLNFDQEESEKPVVAAPPLLKEARCTYEEAEAAVITAPPVPAAATARPQRRRLKKATTFDERSHTSQEGRPHASHEGRRNLPPQPRNVHAAGIINQGRRRNNLDGVPPPSMKRLPPRSKPRAGGNKTMQASTKPVFSSACILPSPRRRSIRMECLKNANVPTMLEVNNDSGRSHGSISSVSMSARLMDLSDIDNSRSSRVRSYASPRPFQQSGMRVDEEEEEDENMPALKPSSAPQEEPATRANRSIPLPPFHNDNSERSQNFGVIEFVAAQNNHSAHTADSFVSELTTPLVLKNTNRRAQMIRCHSSIEIMTSGDNVNELDDTPHRPVRRTSLD